MIQAYKEFTGGYECQLLKERCVSSKEGGICQGGCLEGLMKWGSELDRQDGCDENNECLSVPPNSLSLARPLFWIPDSLYRWQTQLLLRLGFLLDSATILFHKIFGEAFYFWRCSASGSLNNECQVRSSVGLDVQDVGSGSGPWQSSFTRIFMGITFNVFSLCVVYHSSK